MRFRLATAAIELAVPLSAQAGLVINFHDADQSYAYYSSYNTLMYGQGAAPDPGNNVWNGFSSQSAGPGTSDAFFGPRNPNSGHGSIPNNDPGNPYAWFGGTSSTGTHLFSPSNNAAYPASGLANAYSNGTASPITLSLSYQGGDHGVSEEGVAGIVQGSPNKILSEAAVVNDQNIGTFTLGGVPAAPAGNTYDLYLYGANYAGTGGAVFNVTSGTFSAVGGYTKTTNAGGGPLNSFVVGQDYVEFTGIAPTAGGVIQGTWGSVNNTITNHSGEGDFNGLQLVEVQTGLTSTLTYTGTGTPPGTFDTLGDLNFSFNGTPAPFANGDGVIFDDTATGPTTVAVAAGGVSPSSVTFNNSSLSYTLGGGPITGSGTLTLNGSGGNVTLASSNTYTGATSINAGTLNLSAGASIASESITVSPGGTLNLAAAGALNGSNLGLMDDGTINLSSSNNLGSLSGIGAVNLQALGSTLTLTGGSFSGTFNASGSILSLAGVGGTFGAIIKDGSGANSVGVNTAGTWILTGSNTYSGGTEIIQGKLAAASSDALGTVAVTLEGGTLELAPVVNGNLTSPQAISNAMDAAAGTTSAIQIGLSASNATTAGKVGSINISAGAVVNVTVTALAGTNQGVLTTPSLTIASSAGAFTGKLDLGSNDLDITAGGNTLDQITALVASGYNSGKWTGEGIASSAAAADPKHLTALGVILNDNGSGTPLYGTGGSIASSFDGSSPADGDILVKYTHYGDATLAGSVSATDYSRIDSSYLSESTTGIPVSGWYNGDFNYDGVVNGSDYTLIDNAFNTQGASQSAEVAAGTAQIAEPTAVPEPATLGLLAVGALGLLGRRGWR